MGYLLIMMNDTNSRNDHLHHQSDDHNIHKKRKPTKEKVRKFTGPGERGLGTKERRERVRQARKVWLTS